MLAKLIKFEWRYHTGKVLFFVGAGAFLFFGFMASAAGIRIPNIYMNSSYMISHITGLISLGSTFVITIFCANAMLKDNEHKMTGIIYATPVSKFQFLFSRFSGTFLASMAVFSFTTLGIFLSSFAPWLQAEKVGPINLLFYVWPLMVIALPNMLFCGSLVFLIATLTKNRIAVYLGGLFIYVLYIVGSIFSNSPLMAQSLPATAEAISMAAKLDPFGIAAYFEQTRYWTVLEKNTQLIALKGNLLINRLIWTLFSITILVISYKLFSFRSSERFRSKKKEIKKEPLEALKKYIPVSTFPNRVLAQWKALLSLTRMEIQTITKSLSFLVIILLWIFLIGSETLAGIDGGARISPSYPLTGDIISDIIEVISFFGVAVIIFYSSEQIWRNRTLQIDEIEDATPASNVSFFISKYIALITVPGILLFTSIVIGILIQLSKGYFNLDLPLYLSLFYYSGMPFLLIAALALFIQSLIPNKYLGMAITGIVVLITGSVIGGLFGIRHIMLRYAAHFSFVEYSGMNGFGQYAKAFHWIMIYWGALGMLFGLLTYGLWKRGKENGFMQRLKLLTLQLGTLGKVLAVICVLVFISSGSLIYFNTNVLSEYETNESRNDWSQAYEEKYKQYTDLPQPTVTLLRADVDLFPEKCSYQVRGYYILKNKHDQPVKKVLMGLSKEANLEHAEMIGAKRIESDEEFGHYWFEFQQPLQPNEEIKMHFEFTSSWNPFKGHARFNAIVENGSFIRMSRYFPNFGYNQDNELSNPDIRRERGLPEIDEGIALLKRTDSTKDAYDYIDYEVTVSTSEDQIAVTSGNLIKKWKENNRNYFHYKMDRLIPFRFAFSSAAYAMEKTTHKGIDLEIYYHPEHAYNVQRFLNSAKKSIDYLISQFGPYQYKHLRFVEVSAFTSGFAATSYPNTIYILENRGFVTDLRDANEPDILQQLTAHEMAHQWWPGQVDPEIMEGRQMLVETLAQYAEIMIYEKTYDKSLANKAMNVELDLYLRDRSFEKEPPLYRVDFNPAVAYSKGMKVVYAIQDLIGEDKMNQALRNLIARHAYPKPPPNSYDFLDALYEVSSQEHHQLIDDWLKKIMLYDLKVISANYEQMADGQYKVDMKVMTKKHEEDGLGIEKHVKIDEEFEIGIFTVKPKQAQDAKGVLYLKKHHFNNDTTELSVIVNEKPVSAGIDPYVIMIDKDRMDNVIAVEERNE
ncbi:M1 family aminopeptidase [Fulvivirgaceae bacterium BMA10]|uniref:M1 family aminopeptidase n=1 Tax=Splendidivirga corallicola TaxID=3051826 RepID=A0ABT8KGH1_9BACT|nr:M1 family aminopeptidase [Fulvivirgaceae bacterium BMA10]